MPSTFLDIDEEISDTLETFETNLEPPTKDEIIQAIKRITRHHGNIVDEINAEMLNADPKLIFDKLYKLFNIIWANEVLSAEWLKGLIVKLLKKGNKTGCTNWRGATLWSVPSKIFCKIICMRLSDVINDIIRKEQTGFRTGEGCIDHIFTQRKIIEQSIEWNSREHIKFIDFEKAFDSIHRENLWKIHKAYGCQKNSSVKVYTPTFHTVSYITTR